MYNTSRPISAYSMSDYEDLNNVTFKRGKDKKKRKSRKGAMIAGGIAGGALGAGGIAAGVRYGGAELKRRNARKNANKLGENVASAKADLIKKRNAATGNKLAFGEDRKRLMDAAQDSLDNYQRAYAKGKANADIMRSGGARNQFEKDLNRLKNTKIGKSTIGNLYDRASLSVKNVGRAAQGGYRTGAGIDIYRKDFRIKAKGLGKGIAGATKAVWGSGKTGKGALIGAGLAGAGAVGGAGYAAYKAMKKRKNRD